MSRKLRIWLVLNDAGGMPDSLASRSKGLRHTPLEGLAIHSC